MPKDPRDSRQWRALRKQILARDGYVCCYCGQDADTVDHVLPVKNHPDLAIWRRRKPSVQRIST